MRHDQSLGGENARSRGGWPRANTILAAFIAMVSRFSLETRGKHRSPPHEATLFPFDGTAIKSGVMVQSI